MITNGDCRDKTDSQLVSLTLKNQDYFLCIIKRYEDKLLRYIRRISGLSREDAEDVLQNVFIKVYRNLNSYNQDLKFSSWIYRIAHNQVISEFRKKKARPELLSSKESELIFEFIESDLNTEKEVELKLLKKDINKVLNRLEEKYREVLVLNFLEEKSYQEISDILKKPIGTVATLISRAKNAFKKEISKQDIF